MAAGRIKGITVEIGGDTTKLQTVLKGVNSEIKNTQRQLKDVEKLLKLDPSNTELLAQKHKLLGEAVSETKENQLMKKRDELRNKSCFRLSNKAIVHLRKSWISSALMTPRNKPGSHRELIFQEVHIDGISLDKE